MACHYISQDLCVGGITAGCDPAHFTIHKAAFDHTYGQTKSYQKVLRTHSPLCNPLMSHKLTVYRKQQDHYVTM